MTKINPFCKWENHYHIDKHCRKWHFLKTNKRHVTHLNLEPSKTSLKSWQVHNGRETNNVTQLETERRHLSNKEFLMLATFLERFWPVLTLPWVLSQGRPRSGSWGQGVLFNSFKPNEEDQTQFKWVILFSEHVFLSSLFKYSGKN